MSRREITESILQALINCPPAEIAQCRPDLIKKAKCLLSASVLSPAPSPRPQDEEGHVASPVPIVPSPAPSSKPQGEEGHVASPVPIVPSPAPSSRPQGEEGHVASPVPIVPSPTPSSKPQDEEGHVASPVPIVPSPAPSSKLRNKKGLIPSPKPRGKKGVTAEAKAQEIFTGLLQAIENTKKLLEKDAKKAISGNYSLAAYDPLLQDLETGIRATLSDAEKLRHIIAVPIWLELYEEFFAKCKSRGPLRKFSSERGLKYESISEGNYRGRRLRDITSCYREPGLRVLLAFTVPKWKRLKNEITKEVPKILARLCQEDSSITKAMPALSDFYEKCEAAYGVLLIERQKAVEHTEFGLLEWRVRPVEDTDVEDGDELSTTVAQHKNQYGTKRSFEDFEERTKSPTTPQDAAAETHAPPENSFPASQHPHVIPLHTTELSSVCTGPTAVVGVSGVQNYESVAEASYNPSEWKPIRERIKAGDALAGFLEHLLPGEWINDEVINWILSSFPQKPHVRVLDTYFLCEDWEPNPNHLLRTPKPEYLLRQWEATVTQLIVPVYRFKHWTILHVLLKRREIHQYDSLFSTKKQDEQDEHYSCRLMAQVVDQALKSAGEWKFHISFELQQSDRCSCGAIATYIAFCLHNEISLSACPFNPDEWRLQWAKMKMQAEKVSTQNYQDMIPEDAAFATLGDGLDFSSDEAFRVFFDELDATL